MSCVRVLLKNQSLPLITYDIIDTDPEGEKAVVTAPLRTGGLGCEILVKERDLVHDRPLDAFSTMFCRMNTLSSHKTVGKYGVTSFESIVAPP